MHCVGSVRPSWWGKGYGSLREGGHWWKLCRWWGHIWMTWGSKIWILGRVYLKKWNRPRCWGWEGVGELNLGVRVQTPSPRPPHRSMSSERGNCQPWNMELQTTTTTQNNPLETLTTLFRPFTRQPTLHIQHANNTWKCCYTHNPKHL